MILWKTWSSVTKLWWFHCFVW